jgi:hypothetical protein
MPESNAFQEAYAEKQRAVGANADRIRSANAKIAELWAEVLAMGGDLRAHGVAFELAQLTGDRHRVGDLIEDVIVLRRRQHGRESSEAIEYDNGYVAFSYIEQDFDHEGKATVSGLTRSSRAIGKTAKEAALTIARVTANSSNSVLGDSLTAGYVLCGVATRRDVVKNRVTTVTDIIIWVVVVAFLIGILQMAAAIVR